MWDRYDERIVSGGNKMIVGTRCFLYAYKKSDFENQFDSVGLLVRMGSSPIAHNCFKN